MLEVRAVSRTTPIVVSRDALNDEDCCLTMLVVNGRCVRDALSHTFNMGLCKSGKQFYHNKTHLERIGGFNCKLYCCFDTNDYWNFLWTVTVIGMASMMTRAHLGYTQDYLTPRICSPIAGKLDAISHQSPHCHVRIYSATRYNVYLTLCSVSLPQWLNVKVIYELEQLRKYQSKLWHLAYSMQMSCKYIFHRYTWYIGTFLCFHVLPNTLNLPTIHFVSWFS